MKSIPIEFEILLGQISLLILETSLLPVYTGMKSMVKKMLLHVCCANCALHPYDILKDDFDVTLFFYNPNIHPEQEYNKRLANVKKAAEKYGLNLIEGPYDSNNWLDMTNEYSHEPEGAKRCEICFSIRMKKTAAFASENGYDIFATTLTVSPHKNPKIINVSGKMLSVKYGVEFLEADFKKQDGFKKTMLLSKELDLYRQNYCGCIYSIRPKAD
jgi:predicted adenine nucleotide alpha hydrolase (AANH) superfamily ATPase